jgi:GT2 family glycosyltransferase
MNNSPRITIVIGTYNRLSLLRKCLASIAKETRTPHAIEVTDAGSTDGTIEFLMEQHGKTLHATFEGKKAGQAKALNAIFQRLDTTYVCWLSDDNELTNGALDIAIAAMDRDPSLGMVGLKVKDRVGPFAKAPYIGGITLTGVINVNQGVVRLDAMRKVGYFSESFGTYGIDPDLTTKVLLAGYDVALTREVGVLHDRGWPEEGLENPSHPMHQSARFHALYRQKYETWMGGSYRWFVLRALWKALRTTFSKTLHLERGSPIFGHLVRDWHNYFAGRFVSPLRELAHRDPIYLRQHCNAALVKKGIPEDKPLKA